MRFLPAPFYAHAVAKCSSVVIRHCAKTARRGVEILPPQGIASSF